MESAASVYRTLWIRKYVKGANALEQAAVVDMLWIWESRGILFLSLTDLLPLGRSDRKELNRNDVKIHRRLRWVLPSSELSSKLVNSETPEYSERAAYRCSSEPSTTEACVFGANDARVYGYTGTTRSEAIYDEVSNEMNVEDRLGEVIEHLEAVKRGAESALRLLNKNQAL
ncbi:hypothetical protein FGB62_420g00 [Gracilaria domingensis]|nr:hypothetical protein FGB62_420g00 [Gracilaria domingensis]